MAAAIIASLAADGLRVAAFKPAVSGLDEPDSNWPPDHELLAAATGCQRPEDVTPHVFRPAVSPHLAAKKAGVAIELDALVSAYRRQADSADAVICEGVGGLLVPLAEDPPLSVLDLVKRIALPVVVAAHPELGTISDTRLAVDRLRSEGLRVAAVVLSGWPQEPTELQLDNRRTLARSLDVEVAVLARTSPDRLARDGHELQPHRWLDAGM